MLSEQEKREMLEDAKSKARQEDFRVARDAVSNISFDGYLKALDDLQRIFSSYRIPTYITPTKLNKL